MINLDELISDSLYQVNLILLMLQPSMVSPVKPVLEKTGFKLCEIEPELTFPVNLERQLARDNISVRKPATPDLILESKNKEFVIFECKKSTFGSIVHKGTDDGHIRQLRSYLLQIPKVLASALAKQDTDVLDSSLIYLSRHNPAHVQTLGFKEISEQLKLASYQTIEFGLLGLSHDTKNIYLNSKYDPSYLAPAIAKEFETTPVLVQEIDDPDNDPRSYYHIPWMPFSSETKTKDKYSETVFGNAILQNAAIEIAKATAPCKVKLRLEPLINLATNGFYQKWKNKSVRSQLITSTKNLIKDVINLSATKPIFTYLGNEKAWEIDINNKTTQSHIVEAMRKWKEEQWIALSQPELFPLS